MTGVQFYVDSLLEALYDQETPHRIAAFMPLVWSPTLWRDAEANGGFAWRSHPRAHVETAGSDCYLQSAPAIARLAPDSPGRRLARVLDRRLIHPVKARMDGLAEWRARAVIRRYDLLHTPGGGRAESVTYRARRNVATIHDVTTLTRADTHRPENIAMSQLFYDYAKHRCDRVITNSEFSKQDIMAHLGIPADRIDVTPLAPRASARRVCDPARIDAARTRLKLFGAPFVLYAGTLEPRKNLPRLVKAFVRAAHDARLTEHRLVLAGGTWENHNKALAALARDEGIADRVLMPGYVSDDEMNVLMSVCDVFAYVSEYEGFGMPPLEAMTCGAPCVVSNVTSLPEVVGDAGLQVAPDDIEGMAAALVRLLTDERENERQRALSRGRAAQFSWARTAQLTLQSYEAALA
jgi:glycosyltransferase involved in cell wall biosynthesis